MSLLRATARLPLKSCMQAVNASCFRKVKTQATFEGVFDSYCWDHTSGFGYTKEGNLVVVSPETRSSATSLEVQFWRSLLDPNPLVDHEALRDELQMNVIAYDDNAIHAVYAGSGSVTKEFPIYRGDGDMIASFVSSPPSSSSPGAGGLKPKGTTGSGSPPSPSFGSDQAFA